ncbi:MAG: rod shape-determining protein [Eubacteriales bacterium]|nr:rod shape-determining protein [Eubacteriales bacterium]
MFDIGIDLGTTSVIMYIVGEGIVMNEPSVVAIRKSGEVIGVGADAAKMVGKANPDIDVIKPIKDGVIADYKTTEIMIKYFVSKACKNTVVKPRIALCVPSGVTNVESDAVVEIAVKAGARKVYLIEEPVAAAIGAGIDLSLPNGRLIVDIGGGTTDIAVLSLNGIASKTSIKVAGRTFDEAITKYVREKYNLLIGEITAEEIKLAIGSVVDGEDATFVAKGKGLWTGLPAKAEISRKELVPLMQDIAEVIVSCIPEVMDRTLPDLVGDIYTNGINMTGGGSLIHGMDEYITKRTGIKAIVSPSAITCVAQGTGKSFDYLDKLFDGFVNPSTYLRK